MDNVLVIDASQPLKIVQQLISSALEKYLHDFATLKTVGQI